MSWKKRLVTTGLKAVIAVGVVVILQFSPSLEQTRPLPTPSPTEAAATACLNAVKVGLARPTSVQDGMKSARSGDAFRLSGVIKTAGDDLLEFQCSVRVQGGVADVQAASVG